jgi:hypothetical protein
VYLADPDDLVVVPRKCHPVKLSAYESPVPIPDTVPELSTHEDAEKRKHLAKFKMSGGMKVDIARSAPYRFLQLFGANANLNWLKYRNRGRSGSGLSPIFGTMTICLRTFCLTTFCLNPENDISPNNVLPNDVSPNDVSPNDVSPNNIFA